ARRAPPSARARTPPTLWDAGDMPWAPELFSAPALQRLLDRRSRDAMASVPYFDGLMAGEPEALLGSFAGEPELQDPVRGRVKGNATFSAFTDQMAAWVTEHRVTVTDLTRAILPVRGFEEVVLHLQDDERRLEIPFAVVAEKAPDNQLKELRVYVSWWSLTGVRIRRPPVLQPDPRLQAPDVVGEYQVAVTARDVDGVLSSFEPDGYVRDGAGRRYIGHQALQGFFDDLFRETDDVSVEWCAVA